MAGRERRRRSPGEGSVWPYRTKAGQLRYAIGYVRVMPDGTRKSVTRRTGAAGEKWTTERDAKRALRAILAAADKGELTDPSKQPLGAYLGEWLDGLRLAPSTVASYRNDALVFGDHEGRHLHPERFTRTFRAEAGRCRQALREDTLPVIRLHD
jgi:hypothetical protein